MLHNKIRHLSLLVLFIINMPALGQKLPEESLYLKKLWKFSQINSDSLLFYSNKLKGSKNECIKIRAKNFEAKAYCQKGELTIAENITLSILKRSQKNNSCHYLNKSNALARLFWIYKKQNKYSEAYDVVLKRKQLIESNKDLVALFQVDILSVYQHIASLYDIMGKYEESRDTLKKILPKFSKLSNNLKQNGYYINPDQSEYFLKKNKINILNMIGESYLKSSCCQFSIELDSAGFYFRKAYNVAKTLKPLQKDSEALYDLREAEVFIAKKKYHRALQLLRKWDSRAKHLNIEKDVNYLKAISFYNIKNNDSTLYYGKKIGGSREKSAEMFEIIADLYYDKKQLDSAAKYSKLTIKEIKFSAKSIGEISEALHLHEIQKIEQEKNKIVFENKKALNIVYVYFAFAMVLFMILINYLYRKNKIIKHNQIATEKKKDLTVQKKPYSINSKLEKKILEGLNELEKSDFYLEKSFNLNNLAKKLNTNTSYVSQTINKIKGKTFKQYYTSLRIKYIVKKLEQDKNYRKYTIEYIGQLIGYTNASAFTRAFKKHKGITPSEFIKKLEKSGK